MEEEASEADHEVAEEAVKKDRVIAISDAIGKTFPGEVHKPYVCQRIYDFRRVWRYVVVLELC
jgi:hypothetical protein